MREILELLINNPISTLVVFASLSLFIWVVAKNIPNPLDKIKAIFKVILRESNPKNDRDIIEKMNWFSILFFALAFFLQIILFGSSSIIGRIFSDNDPKKLPSLCLITLIVLSLITIYSPLLLILTKGDIKLKKRGKELMGN